jgi:hypothetical protein
MVKDVYEVLREKEAECSRLRTEIEALRLVIPMLDENARDTTQPEAAEPESAPAHEATEDERKAAMSASANESSWWRRRQNSR